MIRSMSDMDYSLLPPLLLLLFWSLVSNLGWLEVIHAAAIYSRLHNRVLDVPDNFVVPKAPGTTTGGEPWPWPEHLEVSKEDRWREATNS